MRKRRKKIKKKIRKKVRQRKKRQTANPKEVSLKKESSKRKELLDTTG